MAPPYKSYAEEIYAKGMFNNVRPVVTTDPRLLEKQAQGVMSYRAFHYISGGAGEKATMERNRLAFRQWQIVPRMLKSSYVDTSVELFGRRYQTPLLMAPIGVQSLASPMRESGLAQACADLRVPYIMSSASSSTFEEVAQASGAGERWFQLYWPNDDDVTRSLLRRAKENGFTVLVVTLDTWSLAWRPADLDTGYLPFLENCGMEFGLADPVFQEKFENQYGCKVDENPQAAVKAWLGSIVGQNHTWQDLKFLKKHWDGPLLVKGIQHKDDAVLALRHGCDGIVVSNHGGRQLDGAIGSLEALPGIVDAVGSKMCILLDSGIRTGSDIIKALSLGARAVLIGRPVIYGYGINGIAGAKAILQGLTADLSLSMAVAGLGTTADCGRETVRGPNTTVPLRAAL